MKKVIFILVVLWSLTLTGCKDATPIPETSNTVSSFSQAEAIALYQQAAAPYQAPISHHYTIDSTKTTTVGANTFCQKSTQTLSYQNFGTDTMTASMEELLQIGDSKIAITEQYANQTGYLSINGATFASFMPAETYISRYVPFLLLDASAYTEITAKTNAAFIIIDFSQPIRAEAWALPEDAQLITASGQAILDASYTVLESTYTITYTLANTVTERTITTRIGSAEPEVQTLPNEVGAILVAPEVFEVPKILEQVCGYLLQAKTVKSTAVNTVTCEAGGIYRCQTTNLELSNHSDLAAEVKTSVDFIDYNHSAEVSHHEQAEVFQQDRYTICVNGEPTQDSTHISAEKMLSYCQEILIQNILLPNDITDIRYTVQEDICHLTFSISDDLVQKLIENTGHTLYGNPSFFHDLSTASQTVSAFCSLTVDRYTGLPDSAGIFLNIIHQIKGSDYPLCVDIQQSFQFS